MKLFHSSARQADFEEAERVADDVLDDVLAIVDRRMGFVEPPRQEELDALRDALIEYIGGSQVANTLVVSARGEVEEEDEELYVKVDVEDLRGLY